LGALFLLSILVLSVLGNTVSFYLFDRTAQPGLTIGDSFWYSVISITTIGYGDFSATTLGARIGTAVFIIVIGLAAFTTAVGLLIDWVAELRHKERTGMGRPGARDHLVIVNFPNESRVRQIIDEFTRDEQHRNTEIVVVTDQIAELPFSIHNVSFVRGSPLEEDTFERANIVWARQAIVLTSGYDDPRSDSLVASIAFVIEHMSPQTTIIVECLDVKHAILFNPSKRISRVYTMQVANNLLVQEAQDPGVNLLTQAITSNVVDIEETLASTVVEVVPEGPLPYIEVAKKLLDHGINLVGVVRDGAIIVGFQDLRLAKDDALVYISKSRRSWRTLAPLLT
jgi:voltage-gated potassium channel